MKAAHKRYDSKYKVTRIHLGDYLALKRISQAVGVSMAEALHQLIEHQAQLPLPELRTPSMPALSITGMSAVRVAPVTTIATNGSKGAAFRIKPKGVAYGDQGRNRG